MNWWHCSHQNKRVISAKWSRSSRFWFGTHDFDRPCEIIPNLGTQFSCFGGSCRTIVGLLLMLVKISKFFKPPFVTSLNSVIFGLTKWLWQLIQILTLLESWFPYTQKEEAQQNERFTSQNLAGNLEDLQTNCQDDYCPSHNEEVQEGFELCFKHRCSITPLTLERPNKIEKY